MAQFEIARLDEDGVITAVESVTKADYRTDPISRTVMLDPGHDMRNRIRNYKWDFTKNQFTSLSMEPLDIAERDTSELVEALVESIEDITDHLKKAGDGGGGGRVFKSSKRWDRVVTQYRRYKPRKEKVTNP